ncbi:MAG: isoprenylcysteine carboxylmethyltransferase family protein [Desulfomonilaceae bacterium]
MLNNLVDKMVEASGKPRSLIYKSVVIIVGASLFVVIIPLLLLLASCGIEEYLLTHRLRILQVIFGFLCLAYGFFLLAWSVVSEVKTGKGTPVPIAPTQKLIIDGPYRKRRNPMLLGAVIYCLGVGTILESITIGLLMSFLILILGTCYSKFIEEKELRKRFGQEYEEYREKTPFLISNF